MEKKWFVYIIECCDGSFYTGVTNDIDLRMNKHATGKGSKYVRKYGFKKLLRAVSCKNKSQACKFEYEIKHLPRNEKLKWFDENQNNIKYNFIK
jgi:putative endonuclease